MKISNKRICNVCKQQGRVFHNGKWWCGLDYNTATGMCKKLKGKNDDKLS